MTYLDFMAGMDEGLKHLGFFIFCLTVGMIFASTVIFSLWYLCRKIKNKHCFYGFKHYRFYGNGEKMKINIFGLWAVGRWLKRKYLIRF